VSVELLELGAAMLGDLVQEVVFVGGATVELWITNPAAPPVRPTKDVDVIIVVTSRTAFHNFEARLRRRGFAEDQLDGVICRWRHRHSGLILDAMPSDASMLGFVNHWQRAALPHSIECSLPSGATIRAVSPPYLLATKLEAFRSRGRGDFLASRDFEDIIAIVDGREEIVEEVRHADAALRTYLAESFTQLAGEAGFAGGVFGALRPDAASQDRAEAIVVPRLRAIIAAREV